MNKQLCNVCKGCKSRFRCTAAAAAGESLIVDFRDLDWERLLLLFPKRNNWIVNRKQNVCLNPLETQLKCNYNGGVFSLDSKGYRVHLFFEFFNYLQATRRPWLKWCVCVCVWFINSAKLITDTLSLGVGFSIWEEKKVAPIEWPSSIIM